MTRNQVRAEEIQAGRIETPTRTLVRVPHTELTSGELVIACRAGQDPSWEGASYTVFEPDRLCAVGWHHDGPPGSDDEYYTHGNLASLVFEDFLDNWRAGSEYAVSPCATRGILVLSVYAVRGQFRIVAAEEMQKVIAQILEDLGRDEVRRYHRAVVRVPVGFMLATLDAERTEFWRHQPTDENQATTA